MSPISEEVKKELQQYFDEEKQLYDIDAIREAQKKRDNMNDIDLLISIFASVDGQQVEHDLLDAAWRLNEEAANYRMNPRMSKALQQYFDASTNRYDVDAIATSQADEEKIEAARSYNRAAIIHEHRLEEVDQLVQSVINGKPDDVEHKDFDENLRSQFYKMSERYQKITVSRLLKIGEKMEKRLRIAREDEREKREQFRRGECDETTFRHAQEQRRRLEFMPNRIYYAIVLIFRIGYVDQGYHLADAYDFIRDKRYHLFADHDLTEEYLASIGL